MDATTTQKELWSYCSANDFISKEKIADFQQRLNQEDNQNSLNYALEKFEPSICPKCKAEGAYKWHFLGKHTHPACKVSWYVDPGTYIIKSLKAIFKTGIAAGGEMGFTENKKGESGGWIGFIFGFLFGLIFRAIFAAITIPVQAVVSLTQKKD